ncbi:DM13 domain-containing protein [Thalassobellus suaedae]|uniref:DM13 domain-containing protein n=1 Tax=Thalassobellus suaedae TaxID=3074124 RepID=A0ABY9Y156_9FLAO|nr:DM13 domain-containing protein [Flavobacteriaceae bacterium HL-DH10]
MRVFYLFFLVLISFQSCSTSSNDDMIVKEEKEMEMKEEMQMEEDMSNSNLLSGDFISGAHTTSGKASVNEDNTTLSFLNFKTDEGPLLEIYLATDTSAKEYITLGVIKGVNGNYEYDLPENIDLVKYNHVLVWCVTFSVNFGHAVLK